MKIKLTFFFSCWLSLCHAQQIFPATINAGGGTYISSNLSIDWSIGETMIHTFNGTPTLTLGVLQPTNGSGVLPVLGFHFFAQRKNENQVLLTWRTQQELGNAGFFIERKLAHETEFKPIRHIASRTINGSSFVPLNYEAIDSNAYHGNAFYRIRQVDIDGNKTWSEIKSVNGSFAENDKVSIWPIPASGPVNLSYQGLGNLLYLLLDASGKQIQKGYLVPGNTTQISGLTKGTYFIRFGDKNSFVKQILVL
jgi:hypothetical protein